MSVLAKRCPYFRGRFFLCSQDNRRCSDERNVPISEVLNWEVPLYLKLRAWGQAKQSCNTIILLCLSVSLIEYGANRRQCHRHSMHNTGDMWGTCIAWVFVCNTRTSRHISLFPHEGTMSGWGLAESCVWRCPVKLEEWVVSAVKQTATCQHAENNIVRCTCAKLYTYMYRMYFGVVSYHYWSSHLNRKIIW